MPRHRKPGTEVDAYSFIKQNLSELGWDTRSPQRAPTGQVFTQNECLADPEIKRQLGKQKPEAIIKVTDRVLWLIEAKRSRSQLAQAFREAEDYARQINRSTRYQVELISAVAGNDVDTFSVRTRRLLQGTYEPVTLNGVEATALLSPLECQLLLERNAAALEDPPIDERLFLARAEHINEILHLGAVNPHQRASVMASLLLSMLSSTGPNIEEKSPSVLIKDINSRVESVLTKQGKPEFKEYIRISLPASEDNHHKFRQALVDTVQELYNLNIRSAMNSGADWLGTFYEVFLKYASWAQDLGIVLTPRHVTRYVAETLSVRPSDIVYDPTCGTGGFLVAALDVVKKSATEQQLEAFKQYGVFGIEQDSGVAALAVVNMVFRGDGKNNIHEGNCFARNLEPAVVNGKRTAKYTTANPEESGVTKVMMNPPFALKRSDEKEYKFIEHALRQVEHGGVVFSVLPYSALVRPSAGYRTWRRDSLLAHHRLLAVMTFPIDLFYPVGVTTVGVFIKKGTPHRPEHDVLWVRAMSDGHLKRKGKRLPNPRAGNDLERAKSALTNFLTNQATRIRNRHQFIKRAPIDFDDRQLELVPEVYLDQSLPTIEEVRSGLARSAREMLAYLVKIDRVDLETDSLRGATGEFPEPAKWGIFPVVEFFSLDRGNFHSLAGLDEGQMPTISRVSVDNGFVGFFEPPEGATVWKPGTITVSTVTGDAFLQPVPFIATDNVVLCTLKKRHRSWSSQRLFFLNFMISRVKWRYSYGRQCYKTKFASTDILLPLTKDGSIDVGYMERVVELTPYWAIVESVMDRELRSLA